MFNFLKKKDKEYVSCEWMEYGIHFSPSGLFHCCMYSHSDENDEPVSNITGNYKYNFHDFFTKKQKHRQQHRNGKINDRCKGCFCLKQQKWDDSNKIRFIAVSTNTKCNANCIYCYTHANKRYFNSRPDIPVYDFLNECIKKQIISSDCDIQFGGGEPVLNTEFEQILRMFIDNSFDKIKIHTSAIKYSPEIERGLSEDRCLVVISADSGEPELYKKIKCVDKFDDVWSNIKKYVQAQDKNKEQVRVKYIIIPGVNDTIWAINKFFEKIVETKVQHILIDIEMEWYKQNRADIDKVKDIFKLVKYMEKYALNLGITYGHNSSVCCAIEEYHKMYDETFVEI